MTFRPNPYDEIVISGVVHRIAEHPSAPGMPYGQEGRAGIVYRLFTAPAGEAEENGDVALKVFKPRFRLPSLVSQAEHIAAYADLPGLRVCCRSVLTPTRHTELLRRFPDLTYAVLMPWIEGPTWLEILLEKKPIGWRSLEIALAFAEPLVRMEEQGIAHCDLSGPNIILPALAGESGVELVDIEGIYVPGLSQPETLSSGSAGYAHKTARDGLWGAKADRFAGGILLAEMLGWCDEKVCQASWGESYFQPKEVQQESERYHTLITSLRRNWGDGVVALFERTWRSDSLAECPTFGEWMITLPDSPVVDLALSSTEEESPPTMQNIPASPNPGEPDTGLLQQAAYDRPSVPASANQIELTAPSTAYSFSPSQVPGRMAQTYVTTQNSGMAIASLIAGILGIFIPLIGGLMAVITGHVALTEIKKSRGWVVGEEMAIAGLVLGYLSLALYIVCIGSYLAYHFINFLTQSVY